MVEILRNTPFRILFVIVPTIFAFIRFRKRLVTPDIFIIVFILSAIAAEIFTLFYEGYNLVQYSLFTAFEVLIITLLVYNETRKKSLFWIAGIPTIVFFLFFYITEYSSVDLLNLESNFPKRSPIDTHQFFDFCSITNLIFIILSFIWLYDLVTSSKPRNGGNTKRFIFLFAFLGYYCGGFFTIAFGRYIIGDITIWFEYWNKIYLPLYLLFYLTLNIGLLWKPTPSSSS
ncbi:MAG: hypothetical protein ACI9JN_001784 [Bacteroidia bacterium]|jgi:hypothetical protein